MWLRDVWITLWEIWKGYVTFAVADNDLLNNAFGDSAFGIGREGAPAVIEGLGFVKDFVSREVFGGFVELLRFAAWRCSASPFGILLASKELPSLRSKQRGLTLAFFLRGTTNKADVFNWKSAFFPAAFLLEPVFDGLINHLDDNWILRPDCYSQTILILPRAFTCRIVGHHENIFRWQSPRFAQSFA
jgi:hypothetical protein